MAVPEKRSLIIIGGFGVALSVFREQPVCSAIRWWSRSSDTGRSRAQPQLLQCWCIDLPGGIQVIIGLKFLHGLDGRIIPLPARFARECAFFCQAD